MEFGELQVDKTEERIEIFSCSDIATNDQLSAVCPELVESSKVANLPNLHNSIHDALRSESKKPELQKLDE